MDSWLLKVNIFEDKPVGYQAGLLILIRTWDHVALLRLYLGLKQISFQNIICDYFYRNIFLFLIRFDELFHSNMVMLKEIRS